MPGSGPQGIKKGGAPRPAGGKRHLKKILKRPRGKPPWLQQGGPR